MSVGRMRMVPAASLSFVVQIAGGAISALTNLYLARELGPAGKGAAQVLVTVPAIIIVISNLGVHVAGAWFIGRERYRLDQVLSAVLWWAFVISSVLALPLWLFREPIRLIVFPGIEAPLMAVSLGCIPFYIVAYYVADVLLASNRLSLYAALRILPLVTYAAMAVVLVGIRDLGVLGATMAFAIGIAASGVFALGVAVALTRGRLRPDVAVMRHALEFGGYVHVGTVAQFLAFRVDVLIVNALTGSAAAGLYAVASALAEMVWYVARSVESVILPRIARARGEEARQISATALRITGGASLAAAVLIGALAVPAIRYVLPAFAPSLPALWLLLPAAVVSAIYMVAAGDLRGRGHPSRVAAISLFGLAANLGLTFALVPMMGFIGAAAASLITYAMQAAMITYALVDVSGISYRSLVGVSSNDLRLFRAITQQPW
jgi:O-antigen/teichoic acid export membrane protein